MMEMGVDSGGLIHDAISSSSENNYPSAEKNDCSDVMSDDNACGVSEFFRVEGSRDCIINLDLWYLNFSYSLMLVSNPCNIDHWR